MLDCEAVSQGLLLDLEETGVDDISKAAIAQNTQEGLVVSRDQEVMASSDEESAFVQAPGDGSGLTFNGRISAFCRGAESTASIDEVPSIWTTYWGFGSVTAAVLLEKEESYAGLTPVRSEACAAGWVECSDSFLDQFHDFLFGFGEHAV